MNFVISANLFIFSYINIGINIHCMK